MTSFEDAWLALQQNEGGFVIDDGGATRYGITEAVARRNGYTGDMHTLPLDLAKSIAKKEYWDPYELDLFNPKVAFQIFDAAYNGGYPVRWLQESIGVLVDGKIGPLTIAAAKRMDPLTIIVRFLSKRIKYMDSLPMWQTYSKGWANRIANNLMRASL